MRAFLALDFDDDIKRELAKLQARLSAGAPGVKWTTPDQMHLTLKFFGEIGDEAIMPIAGAIKSACEMTAPFEVAWSGLGVFPPRGRVNVVWIGLEASAELMDLHRRCDEALAGIGFPPEARAFAPHLTLGRCKDPRHSEAIRAAVSNSRAPALPPQFIDHVTLYESTLTPRGPQYRAVARQELAE